MGIQYFAPTGAKLIPLLNIQLLPILHCCRGRSCSLQRVDVRPITKLVISNGRMPEFRRVREPASSLRSAASGAAACQVSRWLSARVDGVVASNHGGYRGDGCDAMRRHETSVWWKRCPPNRHYSCGLRGCPSQNPSCSPSIPASHLSVVCDLPQFAESSSSQLAVGRQVRDHEPLLGLRATGKSRSAAVECRLSSTGPRTKTEVRGAISTPICAAQWAGCGDAPSTAPRRAEQPAGHKFSTCA